MDVVITDCNYDPGNPNPVFVAMTRLLGAQGVHLSVDNYWSDDYAKADLLIGADPIPDSEVILDTRILGQRTLNRFTRLQAAAEVNAPVARFCSPADDDELVRHSRDWGDLAVLKYDWSMRRNGVFLWPLGKGRGSFPADFDQGRDLFMEFLPGDPLTYKIDTFGEQILGAWILPTRDMRETNWQVISDPKVVGFEPPDDTIDAIKAVSRHLLRYGAGYVSFDLMRTDNGLKVIEMNSCGVGTSVWKHWPEQYAERYAQGILDVAKHLDEIPRYRALRDIACRENNDLAAVVLKPKLSTGIAASPAAEAADGVFGELMLFEELLKTEYMPRRKLTRHWQSVAAPLMVHARSTVPYYADRLDCLFAANGSIDWDRWQEVPFVSDEDIADNRAQMLSRKLPSFYGAVTHWSITNEGRAPFTLTRSHLQFIVDGVVLTRLYHWHGIEPAASMATLLPVDETPTRSSSWTPLWWSNVAGVEHHGDIALPVAEQLRWLQQLGELYLRTTASQLRALCDAVRQSPDILPRLKGVVINKAVSTDLRTLCRDHLGCEIIDFYHRRETGVVALRCPRDGIYHLPSETCLIEIVDEEGRLCKRGQAGEIVVTPLYSYAMPFIRYRTGDIAELPASDPGFTQYCGCGRTLPGITRFVRPDAGTAD
jgi:phenylacetate-CoA ligase